MKEWFLQPATRADAAIITVVVAWVFSLIVGTGVEHNVKDFARELFRGLR